MLNFIIGLIIGAVVGVGVFASVIANGGEGNGIHRAGKSS